jgi:hypothetical protein
VKSGIAKLAMASFYYYSPPFTTTPLPEAFRQLLKAMRSRLRERVSKKRKKKKKKKGKREHS